MDSRSRAFLATENTDAGDKKKRKDITPAPTASAAGPGSRKPGPGRGHRLPKPDDAAGAEPTSSLALGTSAAVAADVDALDEGAMSPKGVEGSPASRDIKRRRLLAGYVCVCVCQDCAPRTPGCIAC